jgi:hypothetical protein
MTASHLTPASTQPEGTNQVPSFIEGSTRMAVDISPVAYLAASGARSLSITEINGIASISVKARPQRGAVAVLWLPGSQARKVAAEARFIAGANPNIVSLTLAIHVAAKEYKTQATPHDAAVQRATEAIKQLDITFERGGELQTFNKIFAERRRQRRSLGLGFMSYEAALVKLKRGLVPVLAQGKDPMATLGLLAGVFGVDVPACRRRHSSSPSSASP